MSVVTLTPKPTVPDEVRSDCIDILEKALTKARSGEINGLVLLMQNSECGHWSDERSAVQDFPAVIGRLTIVLQAWIAHYVSQSIQG